MTKKGENGYTPVSDLVSEIKRQDVSGVERNFLTYLLYWCAPKDTMQLYQALDKRSAKDKRLRFLWDYATSTTVMSTVGRVRAEIKDCALRPWQRYIEARTAVRRIIEEDRL